MERALYQQEQACLQRLRYLVEGNYALTQKWDEEANRLGKECSLVQEKLGSLPRAPQLLFDVDLEDEEAYRDLKEELDHADKMCRAAFGNQNSRDGLHWLKVHQDTLARFEQLVNKMLANWR